MWSSPPPPPPPPRYLHAKISLSLSFLESCSVIWTKASVFSAILRLLLALPLVSPSIKPGPVTLFVSMCRVKTNTHTSVSSSGFRSPGCFASAASVWGSSLAQIVSVWGLVWLVEFLVVLGCVDYWFADLYAHLCVCVCVLLPASVELKDYWLQSFRVACMYVWKFRACWCPIWITNQMVKFVSLIWSEQKTSMPNAHILGFFFWCVKFWFPSARVKIQHLLITSWISDSEANSFHFIDPVICTLMLVLVTSFICCF